MALVARTFSSAAIDRLVRGQSDLGRRSRSGSQITDHRPQIQYHTDHATISKQHDDYLDWAGPDDHGKGRNCESANEPRGVSRIAYLMTSVSRAKLRNTDKPTVG